jgi:hypothetical protein
MLVITKVITHCYTPLHRKLGILTRWQVKYLNQEIKINQFKTSPERPCCSHRPFQWNSGKSRNLPFFPKNRQVWIFDDYYTLLHTVTVYKYLFQVTCAHEKRILRINIFLCKPYCFAQISVDNPLLSLAAASNRDPRWMSYPLRSSEPLVQCLPTILSTWIVDNLCDNLALPYPPALTAKERYITDQRGRKWSTRLLNWVLQQVLEQETDGTHQAAIGAIEHESDLFEGTLRIRCRSTCRGAVRKVNFIAHHYTP